MADETISSVRCIAEYYTSQYAVCFKNGHVTDRLYAQDTCTGNL